MDTFRYFDVPYTTQPSSRSFRLPTDPDFKKTLPATLESLRDLKFHYSQTYLDMQMFDVALASEVLMLSTHVKYRIVLMEKNLAEESFVLEYERQLPTMIWDDPIRDSYFVRETVPHDETVSLHHDDVDNQLSISAPNIVEPLPIVVEDHLPILIAEEDVIIDAREDFSHSPSTHEDEEDDSGWINQWDIDGTDVHYVDGKAVSKLITTKTKPARTGGRKTATGRKKLTYVGAPEFGDQPKFKKAHNLFIKTVRPQFFNTSWILVPQKITADFAMSLHLGLGCEIYVGDDYYLVKRKRRPRHMCVPNAVDHEKWLHGSAESHGGAKH